MRVPTKTTQKAAILNNCPITPVVSNAYCEVNEGQGYSPYTIRVKDKSGNLVSAEVVSHGSSGPLRVNFIAIPGELYRCEVIAIDERCLNSVTSMTNCVIPSVVPSVSLSVTPTDPTPSTSIPVSPTPTITLTTTPMITSVPSVTIPTTPQPTIFACPPYLKDILIIEPLLTPILP